jgi:hypothetical protein
MQREELKRVHEEVNGPGGWSTCPEKLLLKRDIDV